MNFELDCSQQEIKDRAAEFADREVAPHAADWDREARYPAEVFEKLAEAGFMGLCVPEDSPESSPGGVQSSRPVVG